MAIGAVCAVLGGALASASGTWFSLQWKAGWLIAVVGLIAVAPAWAWRLRAVPRKDRRRATVIMSLVASVLSCIAAGVFALSLSAWFHGRDLDDTATLKVPARTMECDDSGDHGYTCFYHYAVDGREYEGTGNFGTALPVTLRVDPAHPGDLGRSDSSYNMAWGGIGAAVLFGGVMLWIWVGAERSLSQAQSTDEGLAQEAAPA